MAAAEDAHRVSGIRVQPQPSPSKMSANRKLLEDVLYRVRTIEIASMPPEHELPHIEHTHAPGDRWEH